MAVAREVAEADVAKWLDFMDIPEKTRKDNEVAAMIDHVVTSVEKGYLIIEDDGSVTHNLRVPLGGGATKQLKYEFRLTIGEFHDAMKDVSPIDAIAQVLAKLQIISKQAPAVLRALDSRDYKIAQALTVFF